MNDSWEERRRAQEEQYFENQNKAALERMKTRGAQGKRLSPITGQPMEQHTMFGVVVDRCPISGGIWLDAGELDQIVRAVKDQEGSGERWISSFFEGLFGKKS